MGRGRQDVARVNEMLARFPNAVADRCMNALFGTAKQSEASSPRAASQAELQVRSTAGLRSIAPATRCGRDN